MKKLLLLIILVIILVSLNWFTKAHAQDLGQMSEDDKAALLQKYQSMARSQTSTTTYETPDMYDSTSVIRLPESQPPKTATKPKSKAQPLDATGRPLPTVKADNQNLPADDLPSFEELRPFGLELFAGPRESAPPDDIASAGDYILGPGDNVVISLWGRVEGEYNLTVDREGKVFIPKVGELSVWGKSWMTFATTRTIVSVRSIQSFN